MILLRIFVFMIITSIKSTQIFADQRAFHIQEEVPIGTKIVNLGKLFNIHNSQETILAISDNQALGIDYFQIDRITFDLVIRKSPDRDEICSNLQDHCYIPLLISFGNRHEPSYDQISVEILDINDNSPTFPQKEIHLLIPENNLDSNSRESTMKLLEATDKDTKENGVKVYRMDGTDSMAFKIEMERKGPRLGLIEKLDRERKSVYVFKLLSIDGGTPSRTGTLTVTVNVEDINDNKPRFSMPQYKVVIVEDTPIDTAILTLDAFDNDSGVNGKLGFRLAEPSNPEEQLANSLFKLVVVNSTSFSITVARDIDCRLLLRDKLEFYVEAFDHGIPPFATTALIDIQVIDVNNNPPSIFVQYIVDKSKVFNLGNKNFGALVENHSRSMIAQITVKDADKGIGNDIFCKTNDSRLYLDEITTLQAYPSRFAVRMYRLFNNVVFDREKIEVVHVLLICEDNIHRQATQDRSLVRPHGIVQLTSSELMTIVIIDVNDEAPQFPDKQLLFNLPENKPEINDGERKSLYKLGVVKAVDKDKDENGLIEYSIVVNVQNSFSIEKNTGTLYVQRSFDREQNNKVSIVVMAQDCPRQGERKSTSAEVVINVTDENDSVPKFDELNYHFRVSENVDHAILGSVSATDADDGENSVVHYELTKINNGVSNRADHYSTFSHFHVDRRTGQIRLRKRLDRELYNHFDIIVIAIDNPMKSKSNLQNTATTNVAITVLDQNDNKPHITSPKNNQEFYIDQDQSTAGHPIFTVHAVDSDFGSNASVNYEIQYGNNELFDLDKTAGLCYLKETLTENHPRSFTLQIKAYDLGVPISLNNTINVRIVRSKPGKMGLEKQSPKSSGFFNYLSVSDKTLVIILTTIFVLLLVVTGLLVGFVRYRRVLWRRLNMMGADYCHGTVMRNYVKGKSHSEGEGKNTLYEDEKYHNLFVGLASNSEKQNEKLRNQPCGYSEYGTLIHNSIAQTMTNIGDITTKRDVDYQPLGHFREILDNYQLPSSHVIINEAAINNSHYELKPMSMSKNICTSPAKGNLSEESPYNVRQSRDRNLSNDPTNRASSMDMRSSSPLLYRIYSTKDDALSTECSPATNKYSNRRKTPGFFVFKNPKAHEQSPKKSTTGSFV